MLDWDDLRHFLAVAREGSTLAAARALRVNQSTVHRHLSALEKELGCKLVERHPTGYRLTKLGRELKVHAERMEESAAALERHIAASEKGMKGSIRVTCSTAVGHRLMKSGVLDRFNARYPRLKVELIMTERLVNLSKGEADIAIRGGDPTDESLIGKKIADVKLVCSGAGAAAIACLDIVVGLGVRKENILVTDSKGVVYEGRAELGSRMALPITRRHAGCGAWRRRRASAARAATSLVFCWRSNREQAWRRSQRQSLTMIKSLSACSVLSQSCLIRCTCLRIETCAECPAWPPFSISARENSDLS